MLSPLEKQLKMRRMLTELDRHDKEEIGIFDPDLGVRTAVGYNPGGEILKGTELPAGTAPKVEVTPQAQATSLNAVTAELRKALYPDQK